MAAATTTKGDSMSASLSPITAVAGCNGSVDGFTTTCSCGLVIASSLRTLIAADAAAHLAWHERRGK
jgi:hypothetical protein